jgi:hypothetical protein
MIGEPQRDPEAVPQLLAAFVRFDYEVLISLVVGKPTLEPTRAAEGLGSNPLPAGRRAICLPRVQSSVSCFPALFSRLRYGGKTDHDQPDTQTQP